MLQVATLFNQLRLHFPRTEFASLVKKYQAERAAKGLRGGASGYGASPAGLSSYP